MKTPRLPLTRSTLAAFFAAPPLVAVVTWLLHLVQQSLAHVSSDGRAIVPRPFGIGFVLIVAVVTAWGGFLPGAFALALALASTVLFLIPPQDSWLVQTPTDWVELAMILLVGMLVIGAVEVARRTRARFTYLLGEAQKSQAQLQAVMNAAPVGVLTCDANGVLNYANPETERIWGQPLSPVGRENYAQYKILALDGQPRPPEKRGLALVLDGHEGIVADAMLVEQPTGNRVRINAQSTRIVGENDATLGAVTVLWDTSAEHEAQEALRRSEERFRSLVEATAQINWNTEANGEITMPQPAWSAYTGQDFAQIRGWGWLQAVHPDDQEHTARAWGEAVTKKQPYQVEHRLRRHDNVYRHFLVRSVPVFSPDGAVREWVGTHSDITERRAAENALQNSEKRYRSLVDATAQFVWTNSPDGKMLGPQPGWAAITGQTLAEYQGYGWASAVHPDDAQPTVDAWQKAVETRTPFVFEHRVRRPDGQYRWFAIRAVPVLDDNTKVEEWVGIHTDITERKAAEEALQQSEERFRVSHDASPDGFMVFESIRSEHGDLVDFRIVYLNPVAETITGRRADDLVGKTLVEEMPGNVETGLFARYQRVTETGQTEQWEFYYNHEGIDSWFSNTAVKIGDGFAVRFADISARKQAEAERDRLLSDAQSQAERESLLNRIGQAQRTSDDQGYVQNVAVSALGEALHADRCYFTTFDTVKGIIHIHEDWFVEGLESRAGQHKSASYVADIEAFFSEPKPVVVENVHTDERVAPLADAFSASRIQSFIAVPLFDEGTLIAALNVASSTPRVWTKDEVELVARAAAQTRSATDLALLRQRDHNIAVRLEEALRPTLPEQVPAFDLAYYYKAALAESSIGGDFFDVFALKDHVILVIGDLSGKGLAAASQIATVRNMLRFAVYQSKSIADALSGLNDAIVRHDLLTGFATLFVAAYSPETNHLYYGSCGHDPVLLRRAGNKKTELLEATGPVMGSFDDVRYDEGCVRLFPGDTLVLYTDGLSEAGRMRHEFLGTDGLVKIVESLPPGGNASELVNRIVEDVGVHAQNTFHDDQCLLVAIAQPTPEKIPAPISPPA